MASVNESVPKFKETIATQVIVRRVGDYYYQNLTWLFDEYPVFEVREAILRRWLYNHVQVEAQEVDWIEQRIRDLKEEAAKTQSDSRFWKDLLNWYVFCTNTRYVFDEDIDLVSRALEFAISITKLNELYGSQGFFYRSDILKLVAGRLKHTPHIYQNLKTPSLKPFLESFLTEIYQSKYDITNYELVDVERVIRCAKEVEDWSFLIHIEKVLAKIFQSVKNQRAKKEKYQFERETVILRTEAFLNETVRFFKEKIAEAENK